MHFSNDGSRVGLVDGSETFLEVSVATGAVVRELTLTDPLVTFDYVGKDLVFVRQHWRGNLWIADAPF
jgi:hypothetical protein